MRGGRAEQSHHRVADELLDRAAATLELGAHALVVRPQYTANLLRIETLGAGGEADKVAEHHRDDLPLLARGNLRRDERRAAHPAQPEAVRILLTTARAGDHG